MTNDNTKDIPGMNLEKKYSTEKPVIESNEKLQKEFDKTKKQLDKLKNWIVKKYPFTKGIGILPPQSIPLFIDEEEVPKETEKYLHLYMIVPEEKFKEIAKIKPEILKEIDKIKGQKIWLQIKTPVDIWENCLDSKFDLVNATAMSFPIYDTGFLGALRLSAVHKSLVVRKFEKYVVSYVIGGSFIRGEATPTSDLDIFVIINDTDVKRMPRVELRERLRTWIYKYVSEAMAIAGVNNPIQIQTYLLTDFWESVKDAHPVIFTFIRDGIPIYDQGTFMPWKTLLRMGRLKPSPEAIDMFMKSADKTQKLVERKLIDCMIDVYYGVLNPSQALIMLHGHAPPTHKETPKVMKKLFFEKEKMLEAKYLKVLEKVVGLFRDWEHEKLKKISGKEIDQLLKDSEAYVKRLKELRKQINKSYQTRTIEKIYGDVFGLLKGIVGSISVEKTIEKFEKEYVKKGKFTKQHLRILNHIVDARKQFKKGKIDAKKLDDARKNSSILINALIEYTQRCDLVMLDKGRMVLKYKDGIAELLNANKKTFLIRGQEVKKLTNKIEKSDMGELSEAVEHQKSQENVVINPKIFELLKKELGSFEIII
jgi:uncharacterized protein (UPF0332 family)/predicted nucleotidyltransferase